MDGRRTIIRIHQSVMSAPHDTTASLKKQVFARHRRSAGIPKTTTIAAYGGVFLLIMSMVAIGYQPPQKMETIANASTLATQPSAAATQPSVDEQVAVNVAAGIAERADLAVAPNVANLSISLSVQNELAQTDNNVISKPQIIQPTADSREVKQYTAKAGDTVQSVAREFGLSPDTVKWANNLSSDAIDKDKKLVISPTDGVIYVVKAGDTIESIASKYNASKDRIVSFNDLELGGLAPGKSIILPGGALPENERPGYVAPRSSARQQSGSYSSVSASTARASAGNRYAPGNCTWFAYEQRMKLGRPIGSFWGNASSWAASARAAGFTVNNTPAPGAIAQWNSYQGGSYGAGHVGIVDSVNSDGSITISEMNYLYSYNRVTSRTLSPSSVSNFIH